MRLAIKSLTTLCLLLASCLLGLAAPAAWIAKIELLHEFSRDTFVENAVLLCNGSLIVSLLTEPTLYLIDPRRPQSPPQVAARFAGFNATVGLAQPDPTTLAVTVGNISAANPAGGHNWAVLLLDLPSGKPATLQHTFPFPSGPALLDSVTPLPQTPDVLLVADSIGGRVYRLHTRTGALDVPFTGPLYEAPNPPPALPIGVNALRADASGRALYFTNSNQRTFNRVPLTRQGTAGGPPATLAQLPPGAGVFDDFALTPDGAAAYVADDASDEVRRVDLRDGSVSVVAGAPGDKRLNHPTSVVYGGREGGREILYVTTAGRLFVGDDGSGGGQVVKVTLGRT